MDKNPRTKAKPKPTKTLQEITKPISKSTKLLLLNQTVGRILKSDRFAQINKVQSRHTKIVTVLGSTFLPSVRTMIHEYILEDLTKRLDLAFSWLFEEYSLSQGLIRHSYIKTGPDNAYNELLLSLLRACLRKDDTKEKKTLLQKLFLYSPLITDDGVKFLDELCKIEDLSEFAMNICKDLLLRKPPKAHMFLKLLLRLSISEYTAVREAAIEKITEIYALDKQFVGDISSFALTQLNHLQLAEPPRELIERDDVDVALWSEDLTKICLRLAMELLPLQNALLHDITNVYVKASSDIKRIMLRAIETPVKKLGQNNVELLKLIENCVGGSETLITRIIYILTEKTTPTQELVNRVKELHASKASEDVRILIPVVCGLSKKELLQALPKFLKLNPIVVKEVFNRLLTAPPESAPITPSELLVTLHTLDPNLVEIKCVVKATSLCIVEREVYTHDVLAAVLQQLVDINPLPTLLMRTVIQALSLYPKMSGFVINLLQRLILKQVWKQKVVWDGFLKCCQRLIPASLGVLLQLPAAQLEDALLNCPDLKKPLTEYARSISENQIGIVSQQVMQVLLNPKKAKSEAKKDVPADDVASEKAPFEPAPPGME